MICFFLEIFLPKKSHLYNLIRIWKIIDSPKKWPSSLNAFERRLVFQIRMGQKLSHRWYPFLSFQKLIKKHLDIVLKRQWWHNLPRSHRLTLACIMFRVTVHILKIFKYITYGFFYLNHGVKQSWTHIIDLYLVSLFKLSNMSNFFWYLI